MARTQTLETWMEVFSFVETATDHHDAAARLERLAASCEADVRSGLLARARTQRQLGDEASAAAEQLRRQRHDIDLTDVDLTRVAENLATWSP